MRNTLGALAEAPRTASPPVWRAPAVRQRIIEYLGGSGLHDATCTFLGRLNAENPSVFDRYMPESLDSL
ncbi:MAG: hypothetical protein ACO3RV_01770 [Luteolibacter sp.]